MKRHILSSTTANLAVALAMAIPAMAAAAGPAAISATAPADETNGAIVVTARRREEQLKDVPLAITAVTAQSLRDSGARDLRSILAMTPGITLDGNSAESNQVPVIRGQYNLNNAPGSGGQPNVGVFLDGIYLQNPSAMSLGLLDVERVEIVKGPVSALYGRNAFGGAINYVSKRPTDQFHSTGLLQAGEYGTVQVTGDINGPLVAGLLRVGLATNYQNSNGAYRDSITGRRAGGYAKRDFKGTFDLTPTSRIDIGGGFYYGNDHFDQTPNVYVNNNCALGTAFCGEFKPLPIEIADIPTSSGNSGNTRKIESGNLHASYDLDFASLNYLGGYNKVTQRGYQDFSALRNGLTFNLNPGPGTANVYELFGADDNTTDFSQELRLSSKADTRFRWSVGGDYYNSKSLNTTLIGLNGAQIPAGQSVSSASNFFLAGLFVTPDGRPSTSNFTQTVTKETTISAFGSAEYDLLSNLTLSAEARYNRDRQSLDIQRNSFVANTFRPFGTVPDIRFHYANYRTSLRYKMTDDTTFYASVASGTKVGGFNGRATIASELSYKPETNTTYEIGAKTSMLDHKLTADIAIYHIDTKGLQINGISDDPHNVGQVVKNFGGTKNTGFEISSRYQPDRDLALSAAFAYTDPKYTNGTTDVNGAFVCANVPSCAGRIVSVMTAQGLKNEANLAGLQLERSSKYQIDLGIDIKHELTADYTAFAHADYHYESKQYSGLEDIYYIGARNLVNVRLGITRTPFSLALNIRNVLNDKTPIYPLQNTQLNNFGNKFIANLPDPRTVSAELSFHF